MKKHFSIKISLICAAVTLALICSIFAIVPATLADVAESEKKGGNVNDKDSIYLDKYVSVNTDEKGEPDGTYTLTIESYVTGEVIYEEVEVEKPADIVLLFDQSSSMTRSIQSSNTSIKTRQDALKSAANKFIKDMAERYKSTTTDHRIALSIFGAYRSGGSWHEGGRIIQDWTELNNDGATSLENTVSGLSIRDEVGTYTDEGMDVAATLFDDANYKYSGDNTDRQKVIILFTDGVPGSYEFETSRANSVIKTANKLKKEKNVKVFTIGLFNGSNANELYASSTTYKASDFQSLCKNNGAINDTWSAYEGIISGGDCELAFIPAANRFLNFTSSNYVEADADYPLGLTFSSQGLFSVTYTFTVKALPKEKVANNFYLTVNNADELDKEFVGISQWIKSGGTTIQLNEKAKVKDIISTYFELPENTKPTDIKTFTQACTGADKDGYFTFGPRIATTDEKSEFKGVTVAIKDYKEENDKRDIEVTGFNFSENYVAVSPDGKPCGNKLVIEFTIKPIEGFMGGNGVPTNDPSSGIYAEGSDTPAAPCPVPHVNIDVPVPSCDVQSQSFVIYKGNGVEVEDIIDVNARESKLYDFVDLTVKLQPAGVGDEEYDKFITIDDGIFSDKKSTLYPKNRVHIWLTPKAEYTPSDVGDVAVTKHNTNQADFYIYVLQPQVSVALSDTIGYYGDAYTVPTDIPATLTWKETVKIPDIPDYTAKTESDVTDGYTAPYTASDISVKLTNDSFTSGDKLTKKDVTFNAEALIKDSLIGGETDELVDVSKDATVTVTTTCNCGKGCEATRTDGTQIVHVNTCSLTVTNKNGNKDETFIYNIMDASGKLYTTVSVIGAGKGNESSVTLKELPIGKYTVVPASNWAWRYTNSFSGGKNSATLSSSNASDTIVSVLTVKDSETKGDVSLPTVNTYTAKY